jgi:hypothetical protein
MDLFQLLRDQWSAVSRAPWPFVLSSVAMFLLAFAACRWRYEGLAEGLREQIQALREHLETKGAQLDEYRERLHLVAASGSKFSQLTHSELKTKALEFVRDLRGWLARRSAEDSEQGHREWSEMGSAPNEEERQRLWHEHTGASIRRHSEQDAEYDDSYKVDAILLRDEMLTRLPSEGARHRRWDTYYEHPVNQIIMKRVADDLERLAKLLT